MMAAFFKVAVCLLGGLAFAAAQTSDLKTFDAVRATLERGGTVVLSFDGSECETSFPFPEGQHRYAIMPWRDWAYVDTPASNGPAIEAFDYSVEIGNPEDFAVAAATRSAILRADGTLDVLYRQISPTNGQTFAADIHCQLGVSGRIFEFEAGVPIDTFVNYNEVKSALLLGKHVDAIMFAEACSATEDWLPTGSVHYGHRIENFAVLNDGLPDEYLVYYHSNLYQNGAGSAQEPWELGWGGTAYALYKNGTVAVYFGQYYPASTGWVNQWNYPASLCQTGISMQFSSFREQDATYVTYSSVKDATLKGHEMELIIFSEFCDVVSGSVPPSTISGHRFDQFQYFEAGELWGEERLVFSTFALTPNARVILDEARVYTDNRVVLDWYRWAPDGSVSDGGELSCDLQFASLFHSISRDRGPSFSYVEVMRAMKNQGAIFEIEVRYDSCSQDGAPVDFQSIYGGVLWESFVRENELGVDYQFVAVVFSAVKNNVNENGLGVWDTATMFITPDRRVEIYPRAYDWLGNDVTPVPSTSPIVCTLNTGGLDGSVYFFRYP